MSGAGEEEAMTTPELEYMVGKHRAAGREMNPDRLTKPANDALHVRTSSCTGRKMP